MEHTFQWEHSIPTGFSRKWGTAVLFGVDLILRNLAETLEYEEKILQSEICVFINFELQTVSKLKKHRKLHFTALNNFSSAILHRSYYCLVSFSPLKTYLFGITDKLSWLLYEPNYQLFEIEDCVQRNASNNIIIITSCVFTKVASDATVPMGFVFNISPVRL